MATTTTATLSSASDILDRVLTTLQPPICLSALTKSYDILLDALANEQDLLLKNQQGDKTKLSTEDMLRQADYLRALQIISKLLIGIFKKHPNSEGGPTPALHNNTNKETENPSKRKQSLLEQTIQRCGLLIKVLEAASFASNNSSLPPSEYEILNQANSDFYIHKDENGMYTYDEEGSESDEEDIFLSMDRRVLEQEEQELLRMANTPIPGEATYNSKEEGGDKQETEKASKMNDSTASDAVTKQAVPLEKEVQREWTEKVYQECQSRKRQRLS